MTTAEVKTTEDERFATDEQLPEGILSRWQEVVSTLHLPKDDPFREQLDRAFRFAATAHAGQTRLTGEPYVTHPIEVAAILADLNVDHVTLIGALLHDVIEDTGVEVDDVARIFGPVVGLLVEGMTKLSALRYESTSNEDRQAEYFRKMLLSMAQDMRVILIKLADRLHNMRTLDAMPPKSRKRIAEETLEIYAPLAHRFGVGRIKWELEDLALKVVDESAYRKIAERVNMRRDERERAINQFIDPLNKRLTQEGIKPDIEGRAKHFYSIYNKIKRRGKSFDEILDLLAVRIIVDSISDCYRTLGVVHSIYKPILERFSDYVAMPKANMYQSLHTKVIDAEGRVVEVQIRTHEMDLVAEVGIAAHWQYKEGGEGATNKEALSDYYLWLRQLIEGSKEESSSEEFMRTLKVNLFTDEVFVFTPKGKLIQLPQGSTSIDFAFAVHTDVGLTTLGTKVNGKMAPLEYQLVNGDTVEILRSNTAKPRVEWLRIANTHRARSKIKRYFRQAHFDESVRLGEEMLKRELTRHRKKMNQQELGELADRLGHESLESLFAAVGAGDLSTRAVLSKIEGLEKSEQVVEEKKIRFFAGTRKESMGVRVKGADNLMISFGNCCNPLPGDRIIGYISKGRGILVHRTDCSNIADLTKDKERLVEVDWDVSPQDRFNARLRIVTEDRPSLLRDIAEVISKMDVGVLELNLRTEGSIGVGTVVINVRSLSHLTRLRNKIGKIKGVVQVERVGVADVAERVL
ncbi:MAG: bifunctional (p)ppGpp synthetase/guanosine-3',5'-bis(diphosphate) 3'-pyrophosphohydrolase [bacterium]